LKRIIISRTDNIGDVIVTLPMASFLKSEFPNAEIIFFGKSYTKPIIDCCDSVDRFLNYDEFHKITAHEKVQFLDKLDADCIVHVYPRKDIAKAAKSAKIKTRIGTSHRFFHLLTCNKLVNLSRKSSSLHEAELNFKLLKPICEKASLNLSKIYINKVTNEHLPAEISRVLNDSKSSLVFHTKSKGSAREWGTDHFFELAKSLEGQCQIFLTGTKDEGDLIPNKLKELGHVCDTTGKLSLKQLILLIQSTNGIVAASTGPLHIGGASGVNSLGLFPPLRPINPARWAPLGPNSHTIVTESPCKNICPDNTPCHCMSSISAEKVRSLCLTFLN
jgi:heptosyltransferase-3